jgi:tetratricopeptide (TPR) repeat protein
LEYFFHALKLYEQLERYDELVQYSLVLVRIGGIYYFDSQYDKSLLYCRRSFQLAQKHQFKKVAGMASRVMGDIDIGLNHYYQKDYQKAIEFNLKSYEIAKKFGYETDYSVSLHNVGEFYYLLKSYKNALQYLDSSQLYCLRLQQFRILLDTYQVKAKVFSAVGTADSVAFYLERVLAIKDSLNNEVYQRQLATINAEMELYRHEAENKLLKKDQRISNLYMNVAFAGLIA